MAEFYVSTSGSDGWNGSSGSPWLTPRHAASAAAVAPGDNINYADGTYAVTASITTITSGSTGALITHRATNARAVTFQISNGVTCYFGTSESNLRFEGIVFQGHGTATSATNNTVAGRWDGGSNVQYYNCEMLNSTAYLTRFYNGHVGFLVDSCEMHHENYTDYGKDCVLAGGSGTSGSVLDCIMYHSAHSGIYADDGANVYARGNTIYNNASHAINCVNATLTSASNRLYGAGAWNRQDLVDWKHGYFISGSCNVTTWGDVIYDCVGAGIGFKDFTGSAAHYSTTIVNCNTAGYNESSMLYYNSTSAASPSGPIVFKNLLFYHTMAGERTHYFTRSGGAAPSGITFSHNLYYFDGGAETFSWFGTSYTAASAWIAARETNTINGSNPQFTDYANDDFTLQASSPCINAGSAISGITDGYFGAAPEIGYWEYEPSTGGSPGAGATTTAVSAPVFGRLTMYIS